MHTQLLAANQSHQISQVIVVVSELRKYVREQIHQLQSIDYPVIKIKKLTTNNIYNKEYEFKLRT